MGKFIIEKNGLYYRPNRSGYTGLKREAGLYEFDEAAVLVGPNGPEGPQDGLSIWAEHEAPEFAAGCAWDVKLKETSYQEGFIAGYKEAVAEMEGSYDGA